MQGFSQELFRSVLNENRDVVANRISGESRTPLLHRPFNTRSRHVREPPGEPINHVSNSPVLFLSSHCSASNRNRRGGT